MSGWSDDDALWRAMAPALTAPERFAAADKDVAAIVERAALSTRASVLDAGCGAGPHALAFAARGFRVTGIDRSPELLRLAKQHAERAGLRITFVEADMRDFDCGRHDLVCSLYSSFGYFDDATNAQILRNFARSLEERGTLVMDVFGRECFETWWQGRMSIELGGVRYSVERSVDDARTLLVETWVVHSQRFTTRQRIYSAAELRAELEGAGLDTVEVTGSYEGTPYDEASRRLVARASKAQRLRA